MSANETKAGHAGESSTHEQIRELREQVETLMRERVAPMVTDAIGCAEDAAKQVSDMARDKTAALTKQVRDKPLTSVLIAAGVGYLIARIVR